METKKPSANERVYKFYIEGKYAVIFLNEFNKLEQALKFVDELEKNGYELINIDFTDAKAFLRKRT